MKVWRRILDDTVEAIGLSDVHLSLRPPIARAEEPDWLLAQARVWKQVARFARSHGNCPILCAGDLFDKSVMPPELINWALDTLPILYAIPGNHDLPSHRADLEHRSAYGTLVRAGKVVPLGPKPQCFSTLAVYGKPFNGPVPKRVPFPADDLGLKHVLVTHQFLWVPGTEHPGARKEDRLRKCPKRWRSFDIVLVGDNHQAFKRKFANGTRVVNPGTLMRRKSNEADYETRVALLWRSGKVTWQRLGHKHEVLSVLEGIPKDYDINDAFVEDLQQLEASSLSFRDALRSAMKGKSKRVRRALLEAIGE